MFILVLKRFNLLKTYVQIVVMFRCKCEGKVTDLYSYVKILSMTNLINSISYKHILFFLRSKRGI